MQSRRHHLDSSSNSKKNVIVSFVFEKSIIFVGEKFVYNSNA